MKHPDDHEEALEHEDIASTEFCPSAGDPRAAAVREFAARQELEAPIMDEEDAVRADLQCPRCGRACLKASRINGVCPRCKKLLGSVHKEVLSPGYKEEPFTITRQIPGEGHHENGERVESVGAETEQGLFALRDRFGWTPGQAVEIISAVDEYLHLNGSSTPLVEEQFQVLKGLLTRCFLQLRQYKKQNGDPDMAERCVWLLLDFPALAGTQTLDGLVKLLGRKKATVNKCLQFFQSQMPELPLLPGQRSESSRANMSRAQKQIWHGQPIKPNE